MTTASPTTEQAQPPLPPNKPEEARKTKPLPSLLVDVTPDEHDTEVDLLLPYFAKRVKANKKNSKKNAQEEDETDTMNTSAEQNK